MLNVLERTPFLADTKDQSKSSLRRLLQVLRRLTDRVPSGPRFTPLVFSTPALSNGRQMFSTPMEVRLSLHKLIPGSHHPPGKHSVKIPASLPAGEYLLRAEVVSRAALMERSVVHDIAIHRSPCMWRNPTQVPSSILVCRGMHLFECRSQ